MKELQCGNHLQLRLLGSFFADRLQETRVFDLFENIRVRGEWFDPSVALLSFIASRCAPAPS